MFLTQRDNDYSAAFYGAEAVKRIGWILDAQSEGWPLISVSLFEFWQNRAVIFARTAAHAYLASRETSNV